MGRLPGWRPELSQWFELEPDGVRGSLDREQFPATTRAYSIDLRGSEPVLFMPYLPLEWADRVAATAAILKDLERLRAENVVLVVRAQGYLQQIAWLSKQVAWLNELVSFL